MNKSLLTCHNMGKYYTDNGSNVSVLEQIDLTIKAGDSIAITGPSGSGKSTLLHLLGGLDKPSVGGVAIEGADWQTLSEPKRCQLRNIHLGFIYQFHHLLAEFSALENVMMPLVLAQKSIAYAKDEANQLLTKVGLGARLHHKPAELSGGERQRVAIARALVHKPFCVLADEPTGNLDNQTARVVFDLMQQLNQEFNTALVIVTHDQHLAKRLNTAFTIQNGRLVAQNS